jgi:hypothetical protein
VIPVALYGIDIEQCEEFFNQFQELLGAVQSGYEEALYMIQGNLRLEHLKLIDEWSGYPPLALHEEVAQEILSALDISSYPNAALVESLLTIEGIDIMRISSWLHFTTHVYPIWNEEACAGLQKLGLNAPFEEDIAAYGIYVGLIEAMKEYAPMDALPESPLPRQRLLEIALARWSRKE